MIPARSLPAVFPLLLALGATAPAPSHGADGRIEIRSADGSVSLRLRGYVQVDARLPAEDADPRTSTFLVRRARPILEITTPRDIRLRVMTDFGGGRASVQDAQIDAALMPGLRLRVGKFKPPFGQERLASATELLFAERGLTTNLSPNRDVGLQFHGAPRGGRAEWAIGAFNGVPDLGSSDGDVGLGKDFVARFVARPWARDGPKGDHVLELAVAGSFGNEEGSPSAPALPSYVTPGQQRMFAYRSDGTAAGSAWADGRRHRVSPQLTLRAGRFGATADFVRSTQRARRDTVSRRIEVDAWQGAFSWWLRRAGPDPAEGPGAFQIVARVGELRVDDQAFPFFANRARSVSGARSAGVGLNWSPTAATRATLDYEETRFADGESGGDRTPERILLSRLQVAF